MILTHRQWVSWSYCNSIMQILYATLSCKAYVCIKNHVRRDHGFMVFVHQMYSFMHRFKTEEETSVWQALSHSSILDWSVILSSADHHHDHYSLTNEWI